MNQPIVVLNSNIERESGRKAQMSNINAAKTVADIIRTCLGPRSMLKMLLDPMGGIVLTNDGNAILREVEVAHPAAKSMIELARTQDEEVGDGTTSVIILASIRPQCVYPSARPGKAGEMLATAVPFLERSIHPIVIIKAFNKALEDALQTINNISVTVDITDRAQMLKIVRSCLGTKFASRWGDLMCNLALDAVQCVAMEVDGKKEVDTKRYARIEKIPGGEIEESRVLDGVMLNKDVTHPQMRRHIENPRILLLDCPLEYKKGESQTQIEVTKESDWSRILAIEEEQIKELCEYIIAAKPDLVFTEKGVSDLAQHYFVKHNITVLRRVKKTDNNRIARACGATIINRVDDIKQSDIGTGCGLFNIEKIGDEYFSFLTKCKNPKACSIILRGPSKDILNEVDRNLQDAMAVARNVHFNPKLCPGGGATEMEVAVKIYEKAKSIEGIEQWPYKAIGEAIEVIPRTLVQNCGGNAIRTLTALRAKHASGDAANWGIDGSNGNVVDMNTLGVWEPNAVKIQTLKTAVEATCMLLRVDDIVSGVSKRQEQPNQEDAPQPGEEIEGREM